MLQNSVVTEPAGTLEKALDLPARSRSGEGRSKASEVFLPALPNETMRLRFYH